jgi:hypothetical protein
MDYQLEQLGDDRFQQLAQSLLIAEHPGIQCFPVGQADGGRDAIQRSRPGTEFSTYQVKFTSQPGRVRDAVKWAETHVQQELPSIRGLVDRGATSYFLVVNVAGTASLDRGTIDRLHESRPKAHRGKPCPRYAEIVRSAPRSAGSVSTSSVLSLIGQGSTDAQEVTDEIAAVRSRVARAGRASPGIVE